MIQTLVEGLREHYLASKPVNIGAGSRPAMLVVDFIEGFTDPDSPLAGDWHAEIARTAELLEAARRTNTPVIFTTVEYERVEFENNLLAVKAPRISILTKGSRWTHVDYRLGATAADLVVAKKYGSAFFGTTLFSHLQLLRVDTLLIAGCVTSGCVRASVVDAAQSGFRTLVVRDAVGDRSPLAHEANLLDIEARYGDVISSEWATQYLATIE